MKDAPSNRRRVYTRRSPTSSMRYLAFVRKMSSLIWSKSRKKIGRLATVSRSTANRARGLEHGAWRDTVFVTLQEPDLEGELRRKINANMEARKVSKLRFLDR